MDERALRWPPRGKEPRIRTLPYGTSVKWCSICGSWGNHFRSGHTESDDTPIDEAADNAPAEGNIAEENISNDNGVGAAVETFAGSPGGIW